MWELADNTICVQTSKLPMRSQRAVVTFKDGTALKAEPRSLRVVKPDLKNEEILGKWGALTKGVIDDERRKKIENICLGLEDLEDVMELNDLLAGLAKNPIA